jgi:hypothetical protein
MKYYKDINGNIYTGDKADYRDKELTEQELAVYMFNQAKTSKLNEIKSKASDVITAKYPEWKQINLTADREYALGFIAKLKAKIKDDVNSELVDKLMGKSHDELKTIRDDFGSLDISDLLIGIPADYIPITKMYYQYIADSFIAYVLCKAVRNWSNAQEAEVNLASTIEQINTVSLEYEAL